MKGFFEHRVIELLFLSILLMGSYLLIFRDLGTAQIRIWDEATYANNALDMYQDPGNILVVTHLGEVDTYNVKPPLVIWLQALSIGIWGINEWAVRFPSALLGFLTVLSLYLFARQVLHNRWIGLVAGLILLTSPGFIRNHVVRTGDLDAALVFFSVAYFLVFLALLIQGPQNRMPYYFTWIMLLLGAFLSKGVAGFFFLPAVLLLALLPSQVRPIGDYRFYTMGLVGLSFCVGYYLLREYFTPGYWALVRDTELLRIHDEVMSWHLQAGDFYATLIREKHFSHFAWALPPMLFAPFLSKAGSRDRLCSWAILLGCFTYFLLISYPPVKLDWYDAPLMPLLALGVAHSLFIVITYLLSLLPSSYLSKLDKAVYLTLAIPFLYPAYTQLHRDLDWAASHAGGLELEGAFLKHLSQTQPKLDTLYVLKHEAVAEHYDPVVFYQRAFKAQGPIGPILIEAEPNFNPGDQVLIAKPEDLKRVQALFSLTIQSNWQEAVLVEILEKVPSEEEKLAPES